MTIVEAGILNPPINHCRNSLTTHIIHFFHGGTTDVLSAFEWKDCRLPPCEVTHYTLQLDTIDLLQKVDPFWMDCVIAESVYSLEVRPRRSDSVCTCERLISLILVQPANAMANSNSSLSICRTFFTPASPSHASEKTTGLPICVQSSVITCPPWITLEIS